MLCEYFYVLGVAPQLILSFRLKKMEKLVGLRIVLLAVLVFGRVHELRLDGGWARAVLEMKEGMLLMLFRRAASCYGGHGCKVFQK